MSWLDDFEVSDIHGYFVAETRFGSYDDLGEPWTVHVLLTGVRGMYEVFASDDYRYAAAVRDHLNKLLRLHHRLTA